ncbi:PREDICTED: ATP-binding cassette sub-family C member 8 [Papilio xuthus]|uniref:ATP-binding cassette sub-family C member 8 n=1 Tax=Papilio xuthus TaxID=66420 RepID=A0AAJ6ZYM1_PAPXU|nr:PREDICTED: ATP-binding cassette sub-family C member 8 [Papilio xuthus]
MEAVCGVEAGGWGAEPGCAAHALAAALHALHLYCATLAAAALCCTRCSPVRPRWEGSRWRGQNVRGTASLLLGVTWCCGLAAAALRTDGVRLAHALAALLAWLAACALHLLLWWRRAAAPLLYLAIYWLLASAASAAVLWHHVLAGASYTHIQIYVQGFTIVLALVISTVDCLCFYDEVTKRNHGPQESFTKDNVSYKHSETHFFSKITFFWLNPLLYKGYYETTHDEDDFGELPDDEKSSTIYARFKRIYQKYKQMTKLNDEKGNMWRVYLKTIWPNFYIAGILKLFGDMVGLIPPLGLAVIVKYIEDSNIIFETESEVTIQEFVKNPYVVLFLVTLALVIQGVLSQNSTHLVTVEGTRLKTALQSMVYDKCMRLASWSSTDTEIDEESPLLQSIEESAPSQSGLITNLISQDTYNVMSCVWVCHYIWAIPLKVAVILYLLYTKLGVSAIIGTVVSIIIITPLQFYIGKRLSDNSKDISKCTDHRVSKMSEILQGMNVIKLYVWEDLFNEKILQLREVELRMLNKDSVYWGILTFTTQASTILITVVTYTLLYFLDNGEGLTVVNVLAGLALFNQLAIPLLILPVTVLMVIQAMVSTNRIKEFLELPESSNVKEDNYEQDAPETKENDLLVNNAAISAPNCIYSEQDDANKDIDLECEDQFFEDNKPTCNDQEYLIRFKNAAFSWKMRDNSWLDVDDLDIPVGKLIMVVGSTGSGKSSFLSAVLGEMHLERGEISWNGEYSASYAGQPPWLLEGSIRENILLGRRWNPAEYSRALRAAALRPDLQLLPDGDRTQLGRGGAPLSGGQRVRVCVARAVYSGARLLALDEPLAALDAALARHVVARGLLPAARAGATVLLATNRLELLHYADLVIAMEEGRVRDVGRAGSGAGPCGAAGEGTLRRWARRAAEARAAVARTGAGPPGGSARERARLQRALSRNNFNRHDVDEDTVGICEATGAHLLAEVPTRAGGSWRRGARPRSSLSRQLSSPPPSMHLYKWRREVRRAVSAEEGAGERVRVHRTLARWTPRTLHRLLSTDSDTQPDEQSDDKEQSTTKDTTFVSITSNGIETSTNNSEKLVPDKEDPEQVISESSIWCAYARACGWWGGVYWAAAAGAQALALAADYWLSTRAAQNSQEPLENDELWRSVYVYVCWCVCGAGAAGAAQLGAACGGAAARRALHERLLRAVLHAPPHHAHLAALHRFSADIAVVDRKLSTAVTRWAQLALACAAAALLNVAASSWTLLACLPAFLCFLLLQNVYLRNTRELQRSEARSAARVVSLSAQVSAGAGTVRAGRLQSAMRAALRARLDTNHAALLLLNAANRWLGLSLDLVGAASVCVSLGAALAGGGGGGAARAGLAGAYALLLPAYLAHVAKCRADLHLQLAALERILNDTRMPQEDYREDCPIPSGWHRDGKIEFENVTVQHHPDAPPILKNINLTVNPGEKLAICGRSGSGKSTLVLTCAGATPVLGGRVLVDGAEAVAVPLRALRHRVLVLPQEGALFSGTLRENLDPLAVHTDDEIWQCLKAVGLYEFVTAQSAGLECPVGGARGARWAGGRGARACAARAALHARFAAALLLDEPGAALDATAERDLLAALAAAAPNTTLITVAHRMSSVRGYDRAVVMEEGRIVEVGSMRSLLSQPSSRLARMFAATNQTH